MASDITWEKTQQILGPNLTTYRRTTAQVQTVTCKNHSSKPFETISNVSKRFQTNSSNSENLWRWYVQRLAAFPSADCLPQRKNNMQYLMSVTCQLRNPLRLIGIVAKTATSSDTTKQSPQIHICRQHIQMLRPKQLFLTSNSDLNVPFCSKLSRKDQCSYQTASIQLKMSQMQKWIHPMIRLLAAKHNIPKPIIMQK